VKYPYKKELLKVFEEVITDQENDIDSLNKFIDNQENYVHLLDYQFEEDQEFIPVPYPTFYKWVKKNKKLDQLLADPVAQRKDSKQKQKQQQKQEQKEEQKEEKEEQKEEKEEQKEEKEEKEDQDNMKIKERIKKLPRQKTKNPDSKKELQKKNNNSDPQNFNQQEEKIPVMKFVKVGGIVIGGAVIGYSLYWTYKKYFKGGSINDTREQQQTNINEQTRRNKEFEGFSTADEF